MESKKYYLVKYMDKKWADKMLAGEILFRSVEGFCNAQKRNEESEFQFHGDLFGGINYTSGSDNSVKNKLGLNDALGEGNFGLIDVLTLREKIYCLSLLEYDEKTNRFIKPDEKMCRFGNTAVVIHNPKQFLYRVCDYMLKRFGDDFWASFKNVDYNVELSREQSYDVFCKAPEYEYQKEFRIALDLANGKFAPSILANVTDFAKLTFPGEIIEDTNEDSISDELILDIGDISDISIAISTSELLSEGLKQIPTPPSSIEPMIVPRAPKSTFFKLITNLP